MSDSGRGWKWQCRNCDRPKIVGDLCAACSESAYQAALVALEASHRERDKLAARVAELEAELASLRKFADDYRNDAANAWMFEEDGLTQPKSETESEGK